MGGQYKQSYNNGLPGPQYNTAVIWNKGILMGKEKRLQTAGYQSVFPGPGTYYLPSNKGKGVIIAERYPDKSFENVPGPGTYNQSDKKTGPQYSLAGSRKDDRNGSSGPGPAGYDLGKSYSQVYNSKPGKSFGSRPVSTSNNYPTPGPDNYYIPKRKMDGLTMQGRYPDRVDNRSPGPAGYNQKWHTIQNQVDSQKPVHRSHPATVNFYPPSSGPGPGQYSPKKYKSPSVKIGKGKRNEPQYNNSPGPGQYYIPCMVADVPKYVYPDPDPRYKWV
jgi:hypothetical protein